MPPRPLRVVIAPDSFGGALDSVGVAAAIVNGWGRVRPEDELIHAPMADGGEGTLAALVDALGDRAERRATRVHRSAWAARLTPSGCCSTKGAAPSWRWPPPAGWRGSAPMNGRRRTPAAPRPEAPAS